MTKARKRAGDSLEAFRARARSAQFYDLCLYIAGTSPHSSSAVAAVTALCEERLVGRYSLVIIDVYQEPARAKADQIIAVPTLLKKRPLPLRRLVGDLSDRSQVLAGLNLAPEPPHDHEEKDS